jgi:general stress protein 26
MDEELKRGCLALLEEAPACYLTTLDGSGRPFTRAVFNLRNRKEYPDLVELFREHEGDLLIYVGTNTSSQKIVQLRGNPMACAYFCVPTDFHGLMLSGRAAVVDSRELRHRLWRDSWTRYYPQGPDDPDYAVVRLQPELAQGWFRSRRFEYRFGAAAPAV